MRRLLIEEEGVEKAPEMPFTIRLETAYFCLNCEVMTNCADICPVCGQRKLWHLENWLGRTNVHEYPEDRNN